MSALKELSKAMGPGPASHPKGYLERVPGKQNWVDRVGGLPRYIERIASHIHDKGKSVGHSIAIAVNAAKKMCASGDLNWSGKQSVNAGSRAAACAAVAEWERKKAQARVSKGDLGRKWTDEEFIAHLTGETVEKIAKCGTENPNCGCPPEKKNRRKKKAVKKFDPSDERVKADLRGKKKRKPTKKQATRKAPLAISDEEFSELSKSIDPDTHPDTFDFSVEANIEKRDDAKQMVFGWCSIAKDKDGNEVVDKQGDVLEDIDRMEAVAYDFVLHSRDGGEMHVRKGVSTLVESFVSTPEKWEAMGIPEGTLPIGWWTGFKVHDEEVWKGVVTGKYRMFSVHGSGTRKAYDE